MNMDTLSRAATALSQSPNAMHGVLIALEKGQSIADVSMRAGVDVDTMNMLVRRARNGDMPKVMLPESK